MCELKHQAKRKREKPETPIEPPSTFPFFKKLFLPSFGKSCERVWFGQALFGNGAIITGQQSGYTCKTREEKKTVDMLL